MKLSSKHLAAAAGLILACGAVTAQDARPGAASGPAAKPMSKAERNAMWNDEKGRLERMLPLGQDRAAYRATLEKAGYWITSINADTPTRLEYEIVKGRNTYEVQVDFKDGRSSKVDVTTNVWKATGTRDALAGRTKAYTYPGAVARDADRVSDAMRNRAWLDEKGRIEAQLGVGHDRNHYKTALERMGYKITSVNESDPRNLEYEVVRGDTSYEVQVDFDGTGRSTKVGVSTNMWETESTGRAKGDK